MEKGTDENIPTVPESKLLEEAGPNREPLKELDARDLIEPLRKTPDGTDDQQQDNESDALEGTALEEQEITLGEVDGEIDSGPENVETEVLLDQNEVQTNGHLELDDPAQQQSVETAIPLQEDPDDSLTEDEIVSDEIPPDEAPDADGELSDTEEPPAKDPQNFPSADKNENGPVALDDDEDDEIDDGIDAKPKEEEKTADGDKNQEDVGEVQDEKNAAKDKDPDEINKIEKNEEPLPKSIAKNQKGEKSVKNTFSSKKIFASTLIIFMVAGAIIYSKPALLGIEGQAEKALSVKTETMQPALPEQIQVPKPKPPGKHDFFLAKLEEVDRLRDDLLAKKEEIYRLKLHYQNGIVELKDKIGREMQEANISSYAQALMNKRMELDLRTIQRRQAYIQGLEKPDRWVHKGSEELLFLKRKGLLDLQMSDIASGIDLDRHMRYMNAAIQTYQPSAEKLAVDPPPAELTSLETIWSQIRNQQVENVQSPIGRNDEQIIAEICSGNFRRIAELSAITANAARCLSRMKGSDIFLNGLTQINAEEAKYLFQWQGNWICLNNVKKLSPAVARYLFKWAGNWISLNGLTEFPPELAVYLMEWKGNQLELMGLNYDKSKPDQRALKYLALWETMGGKLFISDGIRKEMARVM